MPDFEIRYYCADGLLVLVRITTAPSLAEAEEHARTNQESYLRFELRELKGARS